MKVTGKLYGTLTAEVSDYQHVQGLELDLPEGSSVGDLLDNLGIPQSKRPAAAIDGRIRQTDDRISDGAQIHVFQAVHGG